MPPSRLGHKQTVPRTQPCWPPTTHHPSTHTRTHPSESRLQALLLSSPLSTASQGEMGTAGRACGDHGPGGGTSSLLYNQSASPASSPSSHVTLGNPVTSLVLSFFLCKVGFKVKEGLLAEEGK